MIYCWHSIINFSLSFTCFHICSFSINWFLNSLFCFCHSCSFLLVWLVEFSSVSSLALTHFEGRLPWRQATTSTSTEYFYLYCILFISVVTCWTFFLFSLQSCHHRKLYYAISVEESTLNIPCQFISNNARKSIFRLTHVVNIVEQMLQMMIGV